MEEVVSLCQSLKVLLNTLTKHILFYPSQIPENSKFRDLSSIHLTSREAITGLELVYLKKILPCTVLTSQIYTGEFIYCSTSQIVGPHREVSRWVWEAGGLSYCLYSCLTDEQVSGFNIMLPVTVYLPMGRFSCQPDTQTYYCTVSATWVCIEKSKIFHCIEKSGLCWGNNPELKHRIVLHLNAKST